MKKISPINQKSSIAEGFLSDIVRLNELDTKFYSNIKQENEGMDLSKVKQVLDVQTELSSQMEDLLEKGKERLSKKFNTVSEYLKKSNILPGTNLKMTLLDAAIEMKNSNKMQTIISDWTHNRALIQMEINSANKIYSTNKINEAIKEEQKCTILPFKKKKPTAKIYKFERK